MGMRHIIYVLLLIFLAYCTYGAENYTEQQLSLDADNRSNYTEETTANITNISKIYAKEGAEDMQKGREAIPFSTNLFMLLAWAAIFIIFEYS